MARLARSRGRLASAAGDTAGAMAAFEFGAQQLQQLPLPFEKAQLELAWGQALRRTGQRRLAAERLRSAADIFAHWAPNRSSNAPNGNYWPAGWHRHDARTTTPTGSPPTSWRSPTWSVKGMSNRQIAAEIMVSIKTVQAHLTKIYAKVGVTSRAELAAQIHQDNRPDADPAP